VKGVSISNQQLSAKISLIGFPLSYRLIFYPSFLLPSLSPSLPQA
jgi:hypothetical protein